MADQMMTALRRVAAFGLPGAEDRETVSVSDQAWPTFVDDMTEHRLTGLAVAAVDGGALSLTSSQADELAGHHRAAMMWCLAIERKLLEVGQGFDEAGIGV